MTAPSEKMTTKEALTEIKRGLSYQENFRNLDAEKAEKDALSVLTALAEENEHRCDQRDAALESVGLLTKENAALKAEVESWRILSETHEECGEEWAGRALKAEAELDAARPLLEAVLVCPLGALEGVGTFGHGTFSGDILKEARLLKETNAAYRAKTEWKEKP